MNIYAFNPRTASVAVARWVIGHWDADLIAAQATRQLSNDQRDAILAALIQSHPELEQDLQLLSASSDVIGDGDARIDMLERIRSQFIGSLSPEVRAAISGN